MLMLGSTCFRHLYAHHQKLNDDSVGYHIGRLVLELLLVGSVTAFDPDTHPSCLHLNSNQQQLENQTSYVVTNAIVVTS